MAYRHCFWRSDGQLDCRRARPHKLYTTDQTTWQQFHGCSRDSNRPLSVQNSAGAQDGGAQDGGGDRTRIQNTDFADLRQTRDHLRAQDHQNYHDLSPRYDGGTSSIFAEQCAFERRWRIPTKFNYVPLYGTLNQPQKYLSFSTTRHCPSHQQS